VVELLGAYSNRTNLRDRICALLQLPDSEQPLIALERDRLRIRRLPDAEEQELVTGYKEEKTVYALAAQFRICRQTVSAILERHGVKRRYNILTDDEIAKARDMYEQGYSLIAVGAKLGVSSRTVMNVFRREGIATRPVGTNQWS
jgi:AraC-like DNA-binding protein